MNTPAAPLQLARSFACGSMQVELWYTPITDRGHATGRADGDPFRDRIEIRMINRGLPGGTAFDFQSPQPLQFFFSILRKLEDGSLVDLTSPQIDAHHTGRPQPRKMTFTQADETLTDRTSYFGFATIVPDDALVPGEYLVRMAGFEMARLGGGVCKFEPIELPLIIHTRPLG